MEWSSTRLAPALAHTKSTGHRADPNARSTLDHLVRNLNDTLSKSLFVTGAKLTSADIAVWTLLSPEGSLKGFQDIDSVNIWYKTIGELPEVKAALAELPLKDLHFSALQQSNKFGGLHHVVLQSQSSDEPQSVTDSPTHITETVTADEKELARTSFVFTAYKSVPEPRTV